MKKIIAYRAYHWIIGLIGLNFVVLVHELGHFGLCKWLNVATPIFSIGFGPSLVGITIANTTFQLALLPLGGYVSIDPTQFSAQTYPNQLIILLAGIACNIIFTALVFAYLKHLSPMRPEYQLLPQKIITSLKEQGASRLKILGRIMASFFAQESRAGIVGFIGIISITGKSLALGFDLFLFTLAILSLNIGLFNLLPIPFFDGGQAAIITIEKIMGPLPEASMNIFYFIFLILLVLLFLSVALKDVRHLNKRN